MADLKKLCQRLSFSRPDSEYFTDALWAQVSRAGASADPAQKQSGDVRRPARTHRSPGDRQRTAPEVEVNQPASLRAAERTYRLEEIDGSWVALDLWCNVHQRRWPTRPVCLIRVQRVQSGRRAAVPAPVVVGLGRANRYELADVLEGLSAPGLSGKFASVLQEFADLDQNAAGLHRTRRTLDLVALAYWQLLLALPAAGTYGAHGGNRRQTATSCRRAVSRRHG